MNKIINFLKPFLKYILKRLKTITPFESFILVTIIALTVLLVKYFKIKETEIKVRIQVWDYQWSSQVDPYSHRMPHWKADRLKVGQTELDSRGQSLAKIIGIQKYNGNAEGSEVYLAVKLKVDYNKVTKQYTFKNKTVDLGGFIELKMDNVYIFGKIINNDISKNKNPEIEMKTAWRNIRLRYSDAPFWIADKISVGQKTIDAKGDTIAEITNIERYEQSVETSDLYIDIKLKTIYEEKSKQYLFDNKSVNLGNSLSLQFNNIAVNAQIIDDDLPDNGYKKKEIIATAKWYSVEPWQIGQMQVGEKMMNEAKKEAVAEILNLRLETFPNNVFVYQQTGEISVVPHQTKKNVILTIKFNGFEYDNKLFFAGHQRIKPGDSVVIFGKKLTYYLIIQNINQVKDIPDKK